MTALAPLGPEAVAEAVEIFKTLLRFPTINPPGGEKPAIDWIADLLRREGIEPVVLESAPGRANLVARLKGGSAPALLLTGHVDVVPVERDKWTADPFGAEERDGWIYGRGAVDMKHHVAMSIAVFLAAHRRKLPLARDLVLCVVADEEAGCNYGMKWLVEEHGDLLKAGWGLNEFGGFNIHLPGDARPIWSRSPSAATAGSSCGRPACRATARCRRSTAPSPESPGRSTVSTARACPGA